MSEDLPPPLPSAGLADVAATLSAAWTLYAERFWLLMTVAGAGGAACLVALFLPLIAALLLMGAVPALPLWGGAALVGLSGLLWLASWLQVAMIEAVLDSARRPTWTECYAVSWPKVASFSWVSILFLVAVAGGMFFFVLPGVFLAVALVLAPVAAVDEGVGGAQALSRSLELTRGRWLPVFIRLLAAGAATALPGMVPWIGGILGGLIAPFAMANAVVVYRDLKSLPPEPPPPAWRARAPFAAAAVGLLIACALSVRTVLFLRDAMPLLAGKVGEVIAHPPDPQKARQALELLQNGSSAENLKAAWDLLKPPDADAAVSTAAAVSPAPPAAAVPAAAPTP